MDVGVDIGTSEVKVVLIDDAQRVAGQAHGAVAIPQPRPLWSEQGPTDWWATTTATNPLRRHAHGDPPHARIQVVGKLPPSAAKIAVGSGVLSAMKSPSNVDEVCCVRLP